MSDASWTLERHEALVSTNDRLKLEARHGAPDRTVVVAARQTGGRGRGPNQWVSPEGGLYCSILLRDTPVPLHPVLALAAGEALVRTVASLQLKTPVWLKWPNDLLIAPPGGPAPVGKAAGILVETVSRGDRIAYAVIGLGVNLHTDEQALPGGQDPPAVSFRMFQEEVPDVGFFLDVYLTQLERVLTYYRSAPQILVRAIERRLAWRGERVRVMLAKGDTATGTLLGLAPTGGIRVDTDDGEAVFEAWDVDHLERATS